MRVCAAGDRVTLAPPVLFHDARSTLPIAPRAPGSGLDEDVDLASGGHAEQPEALGVRIPDLHGPGKSVLVSLGVLVATSANLPGGPDPRRLDDVPEAIRGAAVALVDGGELPGVPSTVVDLCGGEPVVLREGAVAADAVLARLRWR